MSQWHKEVTCTCCGAQLEYEVEIICVAIINNGNSDNKSYVILCPKWKRDVLVVRTEEQLGMALELDQSYVAILSHTEDPENIAFQNVRPYFKDEKFCGAEPKICNSSRSIP